MKQVEGDRFLSSRASTHLGSSLPPLLIPLSSTFPLSVLLLHPRTFSLPLSWFWDHLNIVISRFVFKLFEFRNRQFCSLLNIIQLLEYDILSVCLSPFRRMPCQDFLSWSLLHSKASFLHLNLFTRTRVHRLLIKHWIQIPQYHTKKSKEDNCDKDKNLANKII